MIYTTNYQSPVGKILLAEKDLALIGLWIAGQKYDQSSLPEETQTNSDTDVLVKTKQWLDRYFCRRKTGHSRTAAQAVWQ